MRRWHARAVTNRRVSPVFVGREAEIETLAGALGEAAAGRPQVVLVGAEAGEVRGLLPGGNAGELAGLVPER